MSDEANKMTEFFNAWWAEQEPKFATMHEIKSGAAAAFIQGAKYAADSIQQRMEGAIK